MKKRISRALILILLITASSSINIFAGNPTNSESIYDTVSISAAQKANLLINIYKETSVQYALISDGKIVVSDSAASYKNTNDTLITKDTMYGIGSISKVYTTAAVMMLADQGKINLDEPVTRYISEFSMADDRYKKITVRMLLNHSSGLMGSSFTNAFLLDDNDSYAKDMLLENLAKQRLKSEPGAYSVYCNDGFTLAELIVEKVSGMSYTDFINKNIIEPLGMENTETPFGSFDRSLLAKTYCSNYKNPMPADTVNVIGTGGIYSTAEEMCKFAEVFMNQPAITADEILSDESVAEMMGKEYKKGIWPSGNESMLAFGLGWDNVNAFPFDRYKIRAVVKGGDTNLYHASLIVLPEYNMAMAVMSSSGVSVYNQVFAQNILLETLVAEGHIQYIKSDILNEHFETVKMPSTMLKYGGIYADSTMMIKADISSDGILKISIPSKPDYPIQTLIYSASGGFENADGNGKISFITESNGEGYMINSGYGTLPELGQIATLEYIAQKTDPIELSDKVKAAWEKRNNKVYYAVSEKYSSQAYMKGMPIAKVELLDKTPGYVGSNKITNENRAEAFVEIPGTAGRDLSDLEFYTEDGREYMKYGSNILISEDYINELYTGGNAVCTIKKDGYAIWYKINAKDAGKTIKVDAPENASFAVYGGDNFCIEYSTVTGNNIVKLPIGGKVVFLGLENARFYIKYQ